MGRTLRNIDKIPMLHVEPTLQTSASQAPKTADKNHIPAKLNHGSRPTFVEMNVSKVGLHMPEDLYVA